MIYAEDALLTYEIETACSLLAMEFDRSDKTWYSLKNAIWWSAKSTDMAGLIAQRTDKAPEDYIPIARAMASCLRTNGYHLTGRVHLGGQFCTSIWRNGLDYQLHLSARNKQHGWGKKSQFDLSRQLIFKT